MNAFSRFVLMPVAAASQGRQAWSGIALRELSRRGHEVVVSDRWSLGRMCAVARDPESGILSAAANPRGAQAYAAGRW